MERGGKAAPGEDSWKQRLELARETRSEGLMIAGRAGDGGHDARHRASVSDVLSSAMSAKQQAERIKAARAAPAGEMLKAKEALAFES